MFVYNLIDLLFHNVYTFEAATFQLKNNKIVV